MVSTRTRPGSREFLRLVGSARTAVTFVQVARAVAFGGGRLTLTDLEPTTVWMAHDDGGRVGHMATGTFLDLWWDPGSGLPGVALRGVLGRADPDAQLFGDAVLRVRSPHISGSGLQYDAELLNGAMAGTAGACVLFLGPGDVEQGSTHPRGPDGGQPWMRTGESPPRFANPRQLPSPGWPSD